MTVEPEAADLRFTVIMPMKAWNRAKSRLHVEPHARRVLADGFARDTLEAVLRCPEIGRVVVLTRGDLVARYVRSVGAEVMQEPEERRLDSLGAAVAHGVAWAAREVPHAPIAIIPSDLPALTPHALGVFLRTAFPHPMAFARDTHGSGTTILTGRSPSHISPAYGEGSAKRHLRLGAFEVVDADLGLRQDVDVLADLVAANKLGLGPNTRRAFYLLATHDACAPLVVSAY